ncbi:uncharacterized protein [Parasteatoda tepidariorum]|uniref:uncharacterized protein isoform X1 n=1 Tax=Parasteatoda tepidariorum TaxID=114398 RepID=UPI001C7289EA|nr:uncharacterized protein LOC107451542 [Parasteatoda tepidariorum]
MWAYGVMVLELFTNKALSNAITCAGNWNREIYPFLFNILQEDVFKSLMLGMFSETGIANGQIRLALNFIHIFLMPDRRKRWSAGKAIDHCFFESGGQIGAGPDLKWQHFGSEENQLISIDRNHGVKRVADVSVKALQAKKANTQWEQPLEKNQLTECENCKVLKRKNAALEQEVLELKKFLEIDEFAKNKKPVPKKRVISGSTQTSNRPQIIAIQEDLREHISNNNSALQKDTFMSWLRKKINACKNRILRFHFN